MTAPSAAAAWLPREEASAASAPLAGIRVLDFSELLPGPFLTQQLAELGADVLKVERPPHGDNARRVGPALFAAMNRGKRSLLADLKDVAQRDAVLQLADAADVLVEGYRPGVMQRLGLDYDALAGRNPRLLWVSLSGYGQDGPRAQWPGHDINYLSSAGVVAMAQQPGREQPSFGLPLADLNGAVYALAALNAALFQRERTGRGQCLDVSLTDCALHGMNARLPVLNQHPEADLATRRRPFQQRPAYGVFRCRDGRWLSLGALEDHFFASLVQALGLHVFTGDGFARYTQRAPAAEAINAAVQAAFDTLDHDDALQRLAAADVPVAEVLGPDALPRHPQFAARGLFVDSPVGPLVRFPVRLAGMPAPAGCAPALGDISAPVERHLPDT